MLGTDNIEEPSGYGIAQVGCFNEPIENSSMGETTKRANRGIHADRVRFCSVADNCDDGSPLDKFDCVQVSESADRFASCEGRIWKIDNRFNKPYCVRLKSPNREGRTFCFRFARGDLCRICADGSCPAGWPDWDRNAICKACQGDARDS